MARISPPPGDGSGIRPTAEGPDDPPGRAVWRDPAAAPAATLTGRRSTIPQDLPSTWWG
jgi:hypothetical protein